LKSITKTKIRIFALIETNGLYEMLVRWMVWRYTASVRNCVFCAFRLLNAVVKE